VVVYWNYETTTCGGSPDGSLTDFQTGTTVRADYADTDLTLLELDDDPDAAWEVCFAGWDRGAGNPQSAVGIHHPSNDEKAISFENDPTQTTSYEGESSPGDGTHIRIIDWDDGTTEKGSSGSPLFNIAKRVVGQLHGGYAACGNDESDWYGRFSVSWDGGGTSSSRLRDWLDPGNTDATVVNTICPEASGCMTLTFDDISGYVGTQYPGVTFSAGWTAWFSGSTNPTFPPHSGTNVAYTQETDNFITLDDDIDLLEVYVNCHIATVIATSFTYTVYDSAMLPLDSVTFTTRQINTPIVFNVPGIRTLKVTGTGSMWNQYNTIDDLHYPGLPEGPVGDPTCSNGIDDDCDDWIDDLDPDCGGGHVASTVPELEFGASTGESKVANYLAFYLLIPIGSVILLRILRKKK
jgi:hypothetical protein